MSARLQPVTLEDLVVAVRRQQSGWSPLASLSPQSPSDSLNITVDGAHPGAGASTVTVALADVLGSREEVTLIDLAIEGEIGAASEAIEVRAHLGMGGYVGGRRGTARIVQAVASDTGSHEHKGAVIVDAAGGGFGLGIDVLVCRATVPSVRKAEPALERAGSLVVAVVGASKWPSPVRNSLGPAMRAAWAVGGVVFFPYESTLEVNGLTAERLPGTTVRAASRLLDLVEHLQASDNLDEQGGIS